VVSGRDEDEIENSLRKEVAEKRCGRGLHHKRDQPHIGNVSPAAFLVFLL